MRSMSGAQLVSAWALSMRAAGRGEKTIGERVRVLTACGLDPATCTVFDIEEWLAAQHHLALSSRRAYTDALRAFFKWLHARGLRADDPTVGLLPVRVPKGLPRPVSTEQLQTVLAAAKRRRTRGYILLAAYAGLRVHEIAKVAGEDVDVTLGVLRVNGKGQKDAVLPLHPRLADLAERMPAEGWWFPSYARPDRPVTGNNVSKVLSDHMTRCGVDATGHQLRHWFGSVLSGEGAQIRVLQESLRHSNLQTVQVYTEVTLEQMRDAIRLLPDVG